VSHNAVVFDLKINLVCHLNIQGPEPPTEGHHHSSVSAFLYPGYASYKTLAQRPASEEDIERWLMYWSVLGCIVAFEYIAEWLISWYAPQRKKNSEDSLIN
jgi:hypothetical protein